MSETDIKAFKETIEVLSAEETIPKVKTKKKARKGKFIFKNINFEFDSYLISNAGETELFRVVDYLVENEKIKIEIGGHTDSVGTRAYNRLLSKRRANSIGDFLLDNGVHKRSFKVVGYGERYRRFSLNLKNRRVELVELPMAADHYKDLDNNRPKPKSNPINDDYEEEFDEDEPNEVVETEYVTMGQLGYYTVQVGAYGYHVDLDFFKGLPDVKEIIDADGMYRYITGQYESFKECSSHLDEVRGYGYQAFIQF
ncbi:MAG: OmpA family protein [Flavobacteriales bacterium]|nr:OmpA family protein [Flavobacteriales bacterium]